MTLSKPVVYISVKEIISTHSVLDPLSLTHSLIDVNFFSQLLLEHEEAIAPDADDPIHEVLRDVGPVPDVSTLLGSKKTKIPRLQSLSIDCLVS